MGLNELSLGDWIGFSELGFWDWLGFGKSAGGGGGLDVFRMGGWKDGVVPIPVLVLVL